MKIKIKSVKDIGPCNFCQRGSGDWEGSSYPYTHIYKISGNSISVRMCEDCMIEFTEKMLALPVISEMELEVPE